MIEIKCMVITIVMKNACRFNLGLLSMTTIISLRTKMRTTTTMCMTHSILLQPTSILRDSMRHRKNKSWLYPISKSVPNSRSSHHRPIPAKSSEIRMNSTIRTSNIPLRSSKSSSVNKTGRSNCLQSLWRSQWGILQCQPKVSSCFLTQIQQFCNNSNLICFPYRRGINWIR